MSVQLVPATQQGLGYKQSSGQEPLPAQQKEQAAIYSHQRIGYPK